MTFRKYSRFKNFYTHIQRSLTHRKYLHTFLVSNEIFTLFDTRWFTIWFRLYTTSFRSILIKQRISENYLLQRLLQFKIIVKNQIFTVELFKSLPFYFPFSFTFNNIFDKYYNVFLKIFSQPLCNILFS